MFSKVKTTFVSVVKSIKQKSKKPYQKASQFVKARPMSSFLIVLGLLLVILIVGKAFTQTKPEEKKEPVAKTVKVYSVGKSPKATFQAKVEKEGVVKIVAQAPGVVMNVPVTEGQEVGQGNLIVSLASNYQGGNAASVQRQIAQTQYQNTVDTYGAQQDLLNKQRNVATNSAEVSDKTREITRQSNDDTKSTIDNNQKQLDQMNQQLNDLLATDPSNPTVGQLQSAIPQLQSGLNQLKAAQRTADYQGSNDNAPAKLSNLQKDITLQQLDIQGKGLDLSREVGRLQSVLASVNEGTMYPVSPFAGIVERVFVKIGQLVNPGDPIATISSANTKTILVLSVPQAVARAISQTEDSTLIVDGKTINVKPMYVSSQATDGTLYSIFYEIPKDEQAGLTDGDYVQIAVPLNTKEEVKSTDPFLPIDAVYQTQESAFVLIASHDKAETKKVKLGSVYGDYVEVTSGLSSGDQIILDRNVVADDKVKVE